MFCEYKIALLLYKTFNYTIPEEELMHLNFNIINTLRQTPIEAERGHSVTIGLSC
jgi:hypothetical protein